MCEEVRGKGECVRIDLRKLIYLLSKLFCESKRCSAGRHICFPERIVVGCVLMYRPIGTPATLSGWYFRLYFPEMFSVGWFGYSTVCCTAVVVGTRFQVFLWFRNRFTVTVPSRCTRSWGVGRFRYMTISVHTTSVH